MRLPAVSERKGFTTFEVLIVVSIGLIIAVVSVPVFSALQVSAQLHEEGTALIQTLRLAQEKSIAGLNGETNGIYFDAVADPQTYTLYQGDTYATRDTSFDRIFKIDKEFALTTAVTGGEANDVTFSLINGTPSSIGSVTLTHAVEGEFTISINSVGRISQL